MNNAYSPINHLKNYVNILQEKTGRNVIVYYSGWLSVSEDVPLSINDLDMNGFMDMCHGLDVSKGLDLILHTPGGAVAATEAIIDYLVTMFDGDIRAIIPQLAMSGGTMIACSCKEIIMGKQSSLGPIDPQYMGVPAQGILSEFKKAKKEIAKDPSCIPLWQQIISRYHPTLLNSCQNAIDWAKNIFKESLQQNMFKHDDNADKKIKEIVDTFESHENTKAHNRHIPFKKCEKIGLKVSAMEDDNDFQDYVLSIHHACMKIFETNTVYKIFCNNKKELLYKFNS